MDELRGGVIFDVKKYAIHDGPGIRTSFFLKGCPLRCWWCHNPESLEFSSEVLRRSERCISCGACEGYTKIEKCPTLALEIVGRRVTPEEILRIALQDEVFYDQSGGGVTFTGGEPLAQPEFLAECLALCRHAWLHTVVDTSGFAPDGVVEKISPFVSLFLFDLKHTDPELHEKYTGVRNEQILKNLRAITAPVNIRVPLIPTVNDDDATLTEMAALIKDLPNVVGVSILPYHAAGTVKYPKWDLEYKLREIKPPTNTQTTRAAQIFASQGIEVQIGG